MYISIDEFAAKWNISRVTVSRMIKQGRLEAYKSGRLVRIPADAVIKDAEPKYAPVNSVNFKTRLRGVLG